MRTILIAGATGFIGSHLLPQCAEDTVHVLGRQPVDNLPTGVQLHEADLNAPIEMEGLPPRANAVIYLAQSRCYRDFPDNARNILAVNTSRVVELLDYARNCRATHFILASSGVVYGSGENVTETSPCQPNAELGFYAATKRSAEILAQAYRGHLNIIILRFFFIYGKGQNEELLFPRLARNVRDGVPIKLQGKDGLRLNPIHVSEAAKAVRASLRLEGSQTINIAGPRVNSLREICKLIGDNVGRVPLFEAETNALPHHLWANISLMKERLFTPTILVEQGLQGYSMGT